MREAKGGGWTEQAGVNDLLHLRYASLRRQIGCIIEAGTRRSSTDVKELDSGDCVTDESNVADEIKNSSNNRFGPRS